MYMYRTVFYLLSIYNFVPVKYNKYINIMKTPFHYSMQFIASGMTAYVGHPTSWEMEIEGSAGAS